MSRSLYIALGFTAALLGFSIGACGEATPPIVAPNLIADPPETTVPVQGVEPAGEGDGTETSGEATLTPDIVIASAEGAFSAGETVEIGIDLDEGFSGVAPNVGVLNATSAELGETGQITADENGQVEFGVYLSSSTTPGSYTVFAEGESGRATVEITLLPSS